MRNLIASLVVVLFVSLSVSTLSAQESGASSRLGLGINTPILDNGAGLTLDYDLSWSPNKYYSYGFGATIGGQRVTHGFISGDLESSFYSSLNAVGRLHLPLENKKFRPTLTLTTGPAYFINDAESDSFNFENSTGEITIRTSLALGHDGQKHGFSVYTAAISGSLFELGFRYYKRF